MHGYRLIAFFLCIIFITDFLIQSAQSSASFCHSCDSYHPMRGDNCFTKDRNHEVTSSRYPNCIIRYTVTPRGLHVFKGIADDGTCQREFNPSCPLNPTDNSNTIVTSISNQPTGSICSYCCRALHTNIRDIYCSDGEFPFPGTLITLLSIATTPPIVDPTTHSSGGSGAGISFCHHCDSFNPINGDDCWTGNKNHAMTSSFQPNCIIRYTMTSHGLHVFKGTATDDVCNDEFNPMCPIKPDTLDWGTDMHIISNQRAGTVCSYCCRALHTNVQDIYCSDGVFPVPDTFFLPTVGSITDGDVTTHRSPVIVNTVTMTSAMTNRKTTMMTTTTSSISKQTSERSDLPNISGLKTKCNYCSIRKTEHGVSCQDTDITCSGDTPLCMTSFYDYNQDTHIEKRCASIQACQTQWWNGTRLRKQCMYDPSTGKFGPHPYQWSGMWSGECHYCCETKPGEYFSCNHPQYPTAPKVLLDMDEFINRYTTTTKSTTTTTPTTTTTTTTPTTTATTTTPTTTTTTTPTTTTTTSTTPSTTASTTTTTTSTTTRAPPTTTTTALPTTNPTTTTPTTTPTTTTSTTTTTASTTTTTTTAIPTTSTSEETTTEKTTQIPGFQCQECVDDPATGQVCSTSATRVCPSWQPYCENTVVSGPQGGGTMHVTKRCASEIECHSDWWMSTRLNPDCMGDLSKPSNSPYGLFCRYCCNTTSSNGAPCNVKTVPDNLTSFALPTTPNTQTPSQEPPSSTPQVPSTKAIITSTKSSPSSSSSLSAITTQNPSPRTSTLMLSQSTPTMSPSTPTMSPSTPTMSPSTPTMSPSTPTMSPSTPTMSLSTPKMSLSTPTMTTPRHVMPIRQTTFTYVTRQCVQCGNQNSGIPCTAFELILSTPSACSHGSGFCLNYIEQKGGKQYVYKSCVDEKTCRLRWYDQSSDNDKCVDFNPATSTGDLSCYFCCTSDGCNTEYKPEDKLLYTP